MIVTWAMCSMFEFAAFNLHKNIQNVGLWQCCNSYSLFVTSYSYSYITKNITSYQYKLQMPKCN
jgi:hypothetical protein